MHPSTHLIVEIVGVVGTMVGLRVWQSRRGARPKAGVRNRRHCMGALVREIGTNGRPGVAGTLRITRNDQLRFDPVESDGRRGAVVSTWAPNDARVHLGRARWDISGARYWELEIVVSGRTHRFGAFHIVGNLPPD